MAVDHVLSTSVTNREAVPQVTNSAGAGAAAPIQVIDDYVTAVASSSVDATYRLVRVPSTAKVKRITFESEAQAAGKFDIGVYYPVTGKTGVADLAANAIDQDFFATAVDCAALVLPTVITNESATYTLAKRKQPLWQALGLSADPGGYLDIVATVVTTAVTTGTGKLGVIVEYTN